MKKIFNKVYKYMKFYFKYLYYQSELQMLQDEFIVNPNIENKKIRSVIIKAIYYKDLSESIQRVLVSPKYSRTSEIENPYYDTKRLKDYYAN